MGKDSNYVFDLPENSKSIIKVMGVGGGGGNAVKHMYNKGIKDVQFIICNTDLQALDRNPVPNKLQIGTNLTEGLGAGADPKKGREAAIENKEEIRNLLSESTKMLFITAGMGGGTGTGAAPVIAEIAKEMGVLTVAIVTAPFNWEGRKKIKQANAGIDLLKKNCDTVLVISNEKLSEIYGNLKISDAFAQADNVLATAAKGIAEIISVHSEVNVDFEDVRTVMRNSGAAVMGSAKTEGEDRATRAAQEALTSPLLDSQEIQGAQKILLSIMSGEKAELQMDELTKITHYIEDRVGEEADMIFGHGIDPGLSGDSIRVTIIATGFKEDGDDNEGFKSKPIKKNEPAPEPRNVVFEIKKPPVEDFTPPPTTTIETTEIPEEKKEIIEAEEEKPKTPEKIVYSLDDDLDSAEDSIDEEQKEEIEKKRQILEQESEERIKKLKNLSNNTKEEGFKEKFEIPAYLRRPRSSE